MKQAEIERWLRIALEGAMTCVEPEKLGKARRVEDASGRYVEYCKAVLPGHFSLNNLKIVVDSANGAGL